MVTIYIQKWFPDHINLQNVWKEIFSSLAGNAKKKKKSYILLCYKYLFKALHVAWFIKIQANVFILFSQWINETLKKPLDIQNDRERYIEFNSMHLYFVSNLMCAKQTTFSIEKGKKGAAHLPGIFLCMRLRSHLSPR